MTNVARLEALGDRGAPIAGNAGVNEAAREQFHESLNPATKVVAIAAFDASTACVCARMRGVVLAP
jgi:hypothetical protein